MVPLMRLAMIPDEFWPATYTKATGRDQKITVATTMEIVTAKRTNRSHPRIFRLDQMISLGDMPV